jgi:DNA-binding NtrC family response regulator
VPQTTVEIFNLAEGSSQAISLKGVLNEAGFRVLQSVHRGKDVSSILAGYKKSVAELLIICLSRGIEYVPEQAFVELHQRVGPIPIVFVLESGSPALLNSLMDIGDSDYLLAPLRPNEVVARISRLSRLKRPLEPSVAEFKERFGLQQFIGDSDALFSEIQKIPQLARCNVCVLICGETGTGKELVARTIHRLSMRSRGPFVPLNCGAIPADLVENELFGHEAGAFTGASTSQAGLIREAEGGTILLDEVDSLPLLSQVKLLRFLQDKEYRPLGAHKAIKADVRVVAASNIQFEEAIQSGRFRADLYYRLNVTSLRVPALRQRKQDIPIGALSELRPGELALFQVLFQPVKYVERGLRRPSLETALRMSGATGRPLVWVGEAPPSEEESRALWEAMGEGHGKARSDLAVGLEDFIKAQP